MIKSLRIVASLLVSILPSPLKVLVYRVCYRYRIGRGVKIGFGVVFCGVARCEIGDGTVIGPLNLFWRVDNVQIGKQVRIGSLNLFRGGERIEIGPFVTIMRLNVLNAIPEPIATNPLTPVLSLGAGTVITTGHWLDFSDRITIGANTIVGGRNSSFWTHSRQQTRPITIGAHCYLGSEIRVAPGVELAGQSIVALGSVLTGRYPDPVCLIAGNPATVLRPLTDRDLVLITRKTREDMPEEAEVRDQMSEIS